MNRFLLRIAFAHLVLFCILINVYGSYPNNIDDSFDDNSPSLVVGPRSSLPNWGVSEPYINLWLVDSPLYYRTSAEREMAISVAYRQRNNREQTNCTSFGPYWEASILSFIDYTEAYDPEQMIWEIDPFNSVMPMGGVRIYGTDGSTEYKSSTALILDGGLSTGFYPIKGFSIKERSGAIREYHYRVLKPGTAGVYRVYLSRLVDSEGRVCSLDYINTNGVVLLTRFTDYDNKTTTFSYDTTFTNQVASITGPYGNSATFHYNSNRLLTNIVNSEGLSSSIQYDSQGLVTNLASPMGVASFRATTNGFAPYTFGGTNQINRSMEVTDFDGYKVLYLYRDQSTKLNASSSVNLIPFSYPTNEVPTTPSFTNSFDNIWMDARNSFSWGKRQYVALSTNFSSSGDFISLTTNDYKLALLRHWHRGKLNSSNLTDTLSMERYPTPDGVAEGRKIWYDYSGKYKFFELISGTYYWNCTSRGTNANPTFSASVLPDGSSTFTYGEYDGMGRTTKSASTYSIGTNVLVRTNAFVYDSITGDLLKTYGPDGLQIDGYLYNGNHQVLSVTNAVGDVISYTYNTTNHAQTSVKFPTGLIVTNLLYSSGTFSNWLARKIETGLNRTNGYSYTNGLIYIQTNGAGLITTNAWNSLGVITNIGTPGGAISYIYSNLNLVRSEFGQGRTNYFGVQSTGYRVSETDALGRTKFFSYGPDTVLEAITNSLQQVTRFTYDFNGIQTSVISPSGAVSSNRFDSAGRLTVRIGPGGEAATNYYNNQGLVVAVSNGVGLVSLLAYDIRDRITNSVNDQLLSVSSTYDLLNNRVSTKFPDGSIESFLYSVNGLVATTNRLGACNRFDYDLAGRKIAETNDIGAVTRYSYDNTGNVTAVVDANGNTNRFAYDLYGRLTNVVNSAGIIRSALTYDQFGLLTNRWTPAKGNASYMYDRVGNLTNIQYAASPSVSILYDSLNRVTNRSDGLGSVSYSYSLDGALVSENGPWSDDEVSSEYNSNGTRSAISLHQPNGSPWRVEYQYDLALRLTNTVAPIGGFQYVYSQGSNYLISVRHPNGASVSNSFTSFGQLAFTRLIGAAGTNLSSYSYSYGLGGHITNATRLDGSAIAYSYDSIGQLRSAVGRESGGAPRPHENYRYGYDLVGNLLQRTNNALVEGFSVNSRNELTSQTRTGTLTVAGSTLGPAYQVTVNGAVASIFGDNSFAKENLSFIFGTNSFIAVGQDTMGRTSSATSIVYIANSPSISYDSNGNLISDGVRAFDYDDEDQIVRITVTNQFKSEFVYNGVKERKIRKEYAWQSGIWALTNEVHYIYENGLVIQERDSSNIPVVTYSKTPGIDGGVGGLLARTEHSVGETLFYHSDGNGNVVALINVSQQVVARYLYDPFGNLIASSGPAADKNLYRFSSKEFHVNSGLVYYGNRYFDSYFQRWLTEDPLGMNGGVNLYQFCGNDGIERVDPFGLEDVRADPSKMNVIIVTGAAVNNIYSGSMGWQRLNRDLTKANSRQQSGIGGGARWLIARPDPRIGQRGWGQTTKEWIDKRVSVARDFYLSSGSGNLAVAQNFVVYLTQSAVEGTYEVLGVGTRSGATGNYTSDLILVAAAVAPLGVGKGVAALEASMIEREVVAGAGEAISAAAEGGGIRLSQKGLDLVESHVGQFGNDAANSGMLQRLNDAFAAGQKVTGADANFYLHEASEATMMGRGLGYDAAHAAAIEKYGVSPFSLYHPEVIQANPGLFNNAWRNYWNLPTRP